MRRLGVAALVAGAGLAGYLLWLARHRAAWTVLLTNRIPAHHVHWGERGKADPDAVLYVALGDSAALGLGASTPERGYVGIVAEEIARITGKRVRVRNLAIDGATCAVVIADELHRLPKRQVPLVCTLDVGANDVWSFEPERFREELGRICAALPPGTIVADLPSFSPLPVGRRVAAANRIVREVVAEHGLTLAPLHAETRKGGPIIAVRNAAGDLFHPNDRGHRVWAAAFLPAVRARLAEVAPERAVSPPAPS
ncbi:SGNH/GDSL hydrolase family protein [Amnibacterium kyonggiense]|uniref:Lysophospholipase L1-like esterase n=1 Tax=Amnibacterium kyonggiense TaxID=595671 RepID=A0A4R7FQH9_9MICO|nr:GDSL-type esterase/lipase family protein [Amnibacterium kyonggiense]TDS80045.1 lysophospholipase L1-like esterase [Amnibacterium kyonggiense]